jgi:hypothetical protein
MVPVTEAAPEPYSFQFTSSIASSQIVGTEEPVPVVAPAVQVHQRL